MRPIRTAFFTFALLGLVPVASNAQPVLAYVAAKDANPKRLESFKKGLAELGLAEGHNIRLEYCEAVLDSEYDGVIAQLVDRRVDVILAANVAATRAAARLTKTIPIVMMAVFDPVGIGVVNSLERPGTNVTGTTMYAPPDRRAAPNPQTPQSRAGQGRDGGQRPESQQRISVCIAARRS